MARETASSGKSTRTVQELAYDAPAQGGGGLPISRRPFVARTMLSWSLVTRLLTLPTKLLVMPGFSGVGTLAKGASIAFMDWSSTSGTAVEGSETAAEVVVGPSSPSATIEDASTVSSWLEGWLGVDGDISGTCALTRMRRACSKTSVVRMALSRTEMTLYLRCYFNSLLANLGELLTP